MRKDILEMAVRCSFNTEFNGTCFCGAVFTGDLKGARAKANKKKHSRAAINFIMDRVISIQYEGTSKKVRKKPGKWAKKRGNKIGLKLAEGDYTEENILGLLDKSFIGTWTAALKVLGRAGQEQKVQQECKGGPKMKPDGEVYYVDGSQRWPKNAPLRDDESDLSDSGVIGTFHNYKVKVGEDNYSRALAKCADCVYEVERVHDLRKHHRNVHSSNCAVHGIPCSAHRASDGRVHEVALQTMNTRQIKQLREELTNPTLSKGWRTWGIPDLQKVYDGVEDFRSGSSKSNPMTSHNVKRRGQALTGGRTKRTRSAVVSEELLLACDELLLVEQVEDQEVDEPAVESGAELGGGSSEAESLGSIYDGGVGVCSSRVSAVSDPEAHHGTDHEDDLEEDPVTCEVSDGDHGAEDIDMTNIAPMYFMAMW